MTKKIVMTDLPGFLEQAETQEWEQASSYAIAPLSKKTKKLRRMCGICFGGYLADFFKTPLREVQHHEFFDEIEEAMGEDDLLTVKARFYMDGSDALFKRVRKSPHFVEWYANSYEDGDLAKAKKELNNTVKELNSDCQGTRDGASEYAQHFLAEYMRKECGGPECPFSGRAWPENFKPHKVISKMLELNPGM